MRFIRCDRAGENLAIKNEIVNKKVKNVLVESTTPGTPQQNGVVERSFAYLYNKIRVVLNQEGFRIGFSKLLWAEAANMVVMMDNILEKADGETAYKKFGWKSENSPRYATNLRTFGEMCVIKDHTNSMKAKLKNKGILGFMVGYPDDCAQGAFIILKLNTNIVVISRYVIWLEVSYGDFIRYHFMKEHFFSMKMKTVIVKQKKMGKSLRILSWLEAQISILTPQTSLRETLWKVELDLTP